MKTSAVKDIIAEREHYDSLQANILNLSTMAAEQADLLKQLETTGDISNRETVDQICRAQVMVALLPRRITHRQELFVRAEQSLLTACHQFISQHFGPRVRAIEKSAQAKARSVLALQITDETALERAVNSSALVQRARDWGTYATITDNPTVGVLNYYTNILKAWDGCDELEKQLA